MRRLADPVLALVDGSPAAANAAWRAALVARDHGLVLRLLHDAARPANDAHHALPLAEAVRAHLGLDVDTYPVEGDALAAVVHAARGAGLLVVGARRGNLLREFVLGTQAERLLRLARIPVLVVKRPALAGYRRVLVPVDLEPGSAAVIASAGLFSRDLRMEVLHALHARDGLAMRVSDVPEATVRRLRHRAADAARLRLEQSIAEARLPAHGPQPAVAFGEPVATVLARERALRAELLVLGKRRRGLLADFFLGGVTQRVLAAAKADVLVLPVGTERQAGVLCVDPSLAAD